MTRYKFERDKDKFKFYVDDKSLTWHLAGVFFTDVVSNMLTESQMKILDNEGSIELYGTFKEEEDWI